MDSKIIFQKSDRKNKKYKATLPDGKAVHFGDTRYEQFKDRTPLKLYSNLDHNDKARRELYLSEASQGLCKYSADYCFKKYLW